jgi:hypothetical protein
MQLASAITSLTNRSEQFMQSVEAFKTLQKSLGDNFENQILSKKRELENLEEEYVRRTRQKRIEMEQEIQEFGLKAATDILTKRGDVAISTEELGNLRTKIASLEQEHATKLKEILTLEKETASKNLLIEKKTLQLEHEKAVASLTSQVESYQKQLTMATEELKKAEMRLEAERTLCQKIAESSSQPAIVQHVGQK